MTGSKFLEQVQAILAADEAMNEWASLHAGGELIVQLGADPQAEDQLQTPCVVIAGLNVEDSGQQGEPTTLLDLHCMVAKNQRSQVGRAVTYVGTPLVVDLAKQVWGSILKSRAGLGRIELTAADSRIVGSFAIVSMEIMFRDLNESSAEDF